MVRKAVLVCEDSMVRTVAAEFSPVNDLTQAGLNLKVLHLYLLVISRLEEVPEGWP
jgi:hypothetical protein